MTKSTRTAPASTDGSAPGVRYEIVDCYKHMAVKGWELPIASALRLDVGPNPLLKRRSRRRRVVVRREARTALAG